MLISQEAAIERVLLGHSRADVRYECRQPVGLYFDSCTFTL